MDIENLDFKTLPMVECAETYNDHIINDKGLNAVNAGGGSIEFFPLKSYQNWTVP